MQLNKLLRLIRIVASVAVTVVLTLALALYGGALPGVSAWLSRIQLLPAAVSFAISVFVSWMVITLLLGRVYCSTVCPMGTVMDLASRSRGCSMRRDYRYSSPLNALRYGLLAFVVLCLMGGWMLVPAIMDPFTAYERMCESCLRPVAGWLTGREIMLPADSPTVMSGALAVPLQLAMGSSAGVLVSMATLAAVWLVARRSGRLVCNTVCPVGATLGIVSRYAVFQPDIDTDKCIQCGRCADVCKSSCIDLTDHVVDSSRCVVCFDCVNVCPNDAIRYTATRKQLSLPMMQQVDTVMRAGRCASEADSLTTQSENTPSDETVS